jgi:hypothetical protein
MPPMRLSNSERQEHVRYFLDKADEAASHATHADTACARDDFLALAFSWRRLVILVSDTML